MTWRVAVDVLCIDVGSVLDQCLNNAKVASQACNMQWRTEVVGSCIDLGLELDEYLDQRRMTLA